MLQQDVSPKSKVYPLVKVKISLKTWRHVKPCLLVVGVGSCLVILFYGIRVTRKLLFFKKRQSWETRSQIFRFYVLPDFCSPQKIKAHSPSPYFLLASGVSWSTTKSSPKIQNYLPILIILTELKILEEKETTTCTPQNTHLYK